MDDQLIKNKYYILNYQENDEKRLVVFLITATGFKLSLKQKPQPQGWGLKKTTLEL